MYILWGGECTYIYVHSLLCPFLFPFVLIFLFWVCAQFYPQTTATSK